MFLARRKSVQYITVALERKAYRYIVITSVYDWRYGGYLSTTSMAPLIRLTTLTL